MLKHVFRAYKIGWDADYDDIWVDATNCTKEEAETIFKRVEKFSIKNNHAVPYTAYEYDGELYHHYKYLGTRDD